MRTKKGNVTAKARKKAGVKGKFPIFDKKSASSALKLRNHGKGVKGSSVIARVKRWAKKHDDKALSKKASKAK
jgi:hypothetical protein